MIVSDITEENIDAFSGLIKEDMAENIGRKTFRGKVLTDEDDALGAIIWEYREVSDFDEEAEIKLVSFLSEDAGEALFEAYNDEISLRSMYRSYLELEKPVEPVPEVLSEQKFSTKIQESRDLYVKVSDLMALEIARKKVPSYVEKLGMITEKEFKQGINWCLYNGRHGIYEDLPSLSMDWFDKDVSCVVRTDGELTGFFMIHRTTTGILVPVLLYASGANSRKDLLRMIVFAIKKSGIKYPPGTLVMIRRHTDETKALSDSLFPGMKGREVLYGERKE